MKQLIMHLLEKANMRNILLIIFTFSIIFYSGMLIFAQQSNKKCYVGVPGQSPVIPCPSQQPANSCLQNTTFKVLYPVSPYQIKESVETGRTAQNPATTPINSSECKTVSSGLTGRYCSATYSYITVAISDYYVTDTGGTVKAVSTVTYREDRDYMNTRLSKGHTLVQGFVNLPNGGRYLTWVPGNTFGVDKNEFTCIMPTTTEDTAKMANSIAAMSEDLTKSFKVVGNLWVRTR